MDTVESFAKVSQLETKKPSVETYRTFYKLFGERRLSEMGGHLVLNRVLHFDSEDRRDVHVVVARANHSMNLPVIRARTKLGLPMHRMPYRAEDFLVASTDGATITQYDLLKVDGIYRAELNGVDKQYDPWYETVRLGLLSEAGRSSASFRRANGDGVFNICDQPTGWILSEAESTRIREDLLHQPVFTHIGHTAVAS